MPAKKMTRAAILAEIEKRTNKILAEWLDNIDAHIGARVNETINTIIANSLGFKDSWGRIEIDRSEHSSVLRDDIGKRALALVGSHLDTWVAEEFPDGKLPKKWVKPLKDEMAAQMYRALENSLGRKSGAIADRLLADVVASLEPQTKSESKPASAPSAPPPPQ